MAFIRNTECYGKNNLSIATIHNVFRETEQTVKYPVSHGLVLKSQFQTRVGVRLCQILEPIVIEQNCIQNLNK